MPGPPRFLIVIAILIVICMPPGVRPSTYNAIVRRKLFLFAVTLSLLVFAAACFLWFRSHFVRDYAWARLPLPDDSAERKVVLLYADIGGGQIEFSRGVWAAVHWKQVQERNELANLGFFHRTFEDVPTSYARSNPATFWNALGFKYYAGSNHMSVWLPCWFAALVSGILPAVWLRGWIRRRRRKPGVCPSCGYDLRATPCRCPECGTDSFTPATD